MSAPQLYVGDATTRPPVPVVVVVAVVADWVMVGSCVTTTILAGWLSNVTNRGADKRLVFADVSRAFKTKLYSSLVSVPTEKLTNPSVKSSPDGSKDCNISMLWSSGAASSSL